MDKKLFSMILALLTAFTLTSFADSTKVDEKKADDAPMGKNAVQKTMCDMSCFEWLPGTWGFDHGGMKIQEVWTKNASEYAGLGVTLKGADTLEVEKMWMRPTDSGFFFIADVKQNPEPTWFKLIASDSMRFVFENPEHDFPQRVIYQLIGTDTLHARIEGRGKDGQERGMTFPYVKMK